MVPKEKACSTSCFTGLSAGVGVGWGCEEGWQRSHGHSWLLILSVEWTRTLFKESIDLWKLRLPQAKEELIPGAHSFSLLVPWKE